MTSASRFLTRVPWVTLTGLFLDTLFLAVDVFFFLPSSTSCELDSRVGGLLRSSLYDGMVACRAEKINS